MDGAGHNEKPVTLPAGASLLRVGQVILDAWEVGSHHWTESPIRAQLLKDGSAHPPVPVPADVMELFRLLQERQVPHLLIGGIAMLTYVQGRNTKDLYLLMSLADLRQIPELTIEDENEFAARTRFRSLQVDVLFTANPCFQLVAERFATRHRFAELEVPTATVAGLLLLKLYALPSLYRQMDLDRVALYENDVAMLLARHQPDLPPLLQLLEAHAPASDVRELRQIAGECAERAGRLRERTLGTG
jgi:hypothetical protein